MKRLRASVVAALALALLVAPAGLPPAAGQSTPDTRTVTIGTLGGLFSTLWAVNNDNAAVGWSDVSYTDSEHAILWQDGRLIDLGTLPGDQVSRALGVNDLGQVVGLSMNNEGPSRIARPVLWQEGQAIELPGGEGCTATAINNKGHIAICGGGIWRDGQWAFIGTLPGYRSVFVDAINDAGVAVGSMTDLAGRSTAFRWEDGVLTDLGAMVGGVRSVATAINARGQVVGYVSRSTAVGDAEPVVWERNTVTPLGGTWGTFKGVARGINHRGDVIGNGGFADGSANGTFVWSRGRFRFLDANLVLLDINERGTAVGHSWENGWPEGVLVPKADTRVHPAAGSRSVLWPGAAEHLPRHVDR
jgi:probable HAF family extracellular repeat protein